MTVRVHIHLKVANLDHSRDFYERFLGVQPAKLKPDQIKFLPECAPLNLTLTPMRTPADDNRHAVNHLGIEVASRDAVLTHLHRVKAAGIAVREQLEVNCCYANQSKFWVIDPDGVEWELYHLNYDLEEKHGPRKLASAAL
ncbi:MAG: ArsI/CadI family heavy metal resistance metalloenzyme [Candidatus Binataceae bacterium]